MPLVVDSVLAFFLDGSYFTSVAWTLIWLNLYRRLENWHVQLVWGVSPRLVSRYSFIINWSRGCTTKFTECISAYVSTSVRLCTCALLRYRSVTLITDIVVCCSVIIRMRIVCTAGGNFILVVLLVAVNGTIAAVVATEDQLIVVGFTGGGSFLFLDCGVVLRLRVGFMAVEVLIFAIILVCWLAKRVIL